MRKYHKGNSRVVAWYYRQSIADRVALWTILAAVGYFGGHMVAFALR